MHNERTGFNSDYSFLVLVINWTFPGLPETEIVVGASRNWSLNRHLSDVVDYLDNHWSLRVEPARKGRIPVQVRRNSDSTYHAMLLLLLTHPSFQPGLVKGGIKAQSKRGRFGKT